jgi:lipid-binding SYLF domain-containing protein
LDTLSDATLMHMKADDPGLETFLKNAYGYVIFPAVGKGGLIVGGAYGRGQIYEQGNLIGYSDITQATIGAQVGGQEFSEIIAFENKPALDKFVTTKYELSASASAVILKSGAAANAKYTDGIVIFTQVKGGAMLEAAVGGQRFNFAPLR